MDEFLYRIGLIDYVTIQSKIGKDEILERLKDIIEIPFSIPDKKVKKLYEGQVLDSEFTFRRKKGFLGFDNDSETLVKVLGTIKEDNGQVIINTKIVVQTREVFMTWSIIGVLFIMVPILANLEQFKWDVLLLVIGVLLFFIFQRYSNLKKGVDKMSRTVDLELNNLVRQENTPQQGI